MPNGHSPEMSQKNESSDDCSVNRVCAGEIGPPSVMPTGQEDAPVEKPSRRWLMRVLLGIGELAMDQWFLIVMGILIAFSSQVQVPRAHQELKQTMINYMSVAIIFLINGCTLPTTVLVENLGRWKIHIFVQVQCYLLTSATSYGVVSAAAANPRFMDPALLVGIVIMGCLPTAIAFNTIMTRKANGNAALTVAQSTIGNLLGPFVTTALIKLYTSTDVWYVGILPESQGFGETYRYVFKQLGLSVFVPLAVGQLVVKLFPNLVRKVLVEWKVSKISSCALLVLIWSTYDGAFASNAFGNIPSNNMIFTVFILVALFFVWITIAFVVSQIWLSREDTIAVAYLVSTKTPAMGVPLTTIMFAGLTAAEQSRTRLPMVIFQAIQISGSSVLTILLRKWQARGKVDRTEEDD
ncbi:bile acid:sodium symporter family protein [Aspergillus clavatus NRRL 1]|uniref:Sodium bile acid symporter family protein n=1 Tax=Aspergillus clavatus (strain ATCC 1007 / CBS 513.65 / DSM 816 / NCTC 3887 / NRRL 1 / QM 1276 / 107) TaxID=344612 RepID=A1CSG3_ASPCL|nr:sodium bile acid symporter family protein [Aspergillus clavatus NRRL 1]EAW08584.1 sodium bile acid symporter family protein [Aspergillus clavatus NRRL 1]